MVFLEKGTLSWRNANENMRQSERVESERSGTSLCQNGEMVAFDCKAPTFTETCLPSAGMRSGTGTNLH